MSDQTPVVVQVEVQHEPRIRNVLIGAVLLLAFIASLGVWGPLWVLDATNWILETLVKPLGEWIADQFDRANNIDQAPPPAGG